nr:transporter substrate-binding domain-containing protein [Halopolyspora algeriensis]
MAGCGGSNSGGQAKGVPLVTEGQLTTCTHLPYEPFQFRQNDEIVGFDVDLVDAVAKDLGVPQKIINIPFETIESGQALNVGDCDLAAAGMTITENRDKNFDFSDPYFEATQALITKKGSGIDSFEQLKGKTLAVQKSTTGKKYAEENAAPLGVELKTYPDLGLLLQAVKNGEVAAGINDDFVLYNYVDKNPSMAVTTEFATGEQYGMGVRTGNDKMREKINEVLARLKENGTYDRLYKKWFDKAPAAN